MSETLSSGRSATREVNNGVYFIDVKGDLGEGITVDWSDDGSSWNPLQRDIGYSLTLSSDSNFLVTLGAGYISLNMTGTGAADYSIINVG